MIVVSFMGYAYRIPKIYSIFWIIFRKIVQKFGLAQ